MTLTRKHSYLSPTLALALAATLAAALVGCSRSKSPSAATSTSSASSAPSTTSSTSSAPSTTTSTQGSASSADNTAIRAAYATFFDVKTPVAASMAVLQDGAEFKDVLIEQGKSANAAKATITVSNVVVNSASKATVTFSVLLSGSPVLVNQTGYAVHEGGVWKVAGVTFCGLLAAQGTPPPVCSKPVATSLPS